MLSGAELDELAEKITAKLGGSVISSAIPAEIGECIRTSVNGHQWQASFWLPLNGPYGIQTTWYFEVDGVIRLELGDTSGCVFWRGKFLPEETRNADS